MIEGKVAIITGGGKGIGRFIAGTFVDAGAKVVIAEIDRDALDRTAADLSARGGEVLAVATDVRDEAQVKSMVEQSMRQFGRIDVLINNAAVVSHSHIWPDPGWGEPWPVVADMPFDFWKKVMETSVNGTWLCCKYVIPHMAAQGSGHIITIPGGGQPAKIGVLAYAMAKQITTSFARYLAEEVRPSNICVVAVNPGATLATEDAPEQVREKYPGVEVVGNRYVLAAEAPMELTGRSLVLRDGKLEASNSN
jgi:NAD(P)-dependent dehydrogenase (short-subunit alcohol dehydrogenase family)